MPQLYHVLAMLATGGAPSTSPLELESRMSIVYAEGASPKQCVAPLSTYRIWLRLGVVGVW